MDKPNKSKLLAVANYINNHYKKTYRQDIRSRISMQKFCYYAYVWHYIWTGEKLFGEQDFRARQYGAFSSTLHDFQAEKDHNGYILDPEDFPADLPSLSDAETENINKAMNFYFGFSPFAIAELNHREDPWIRNEKDGGFMTDEQIKEFFGGGKTGMPDIDINNFYIERFAKK